MILTVEHKMRGRDTIAFESSDRDLSGRRQSTLRIHDDFVQRIQRLEAEKDSLYQLLSDLLLKNERLRQVAADCPLCVDCPSPTWFVRS